MYLPRYLALLKLSEKQLADAFLMVSDRHDRDSDIRETCKMLASWSQAHIEDLAPFIARYGEDKSTNEQAHALRGALFHGARVGEIGLLADLQDLLTLANKVVLQWTIVLQAAKGLRDKELEVKAEDSCKQADRQVSWLRTHIKSDTPQALLVEANKASELSGSMPKKQTTGTVPEMIWSPISSALLMLVAGIAGVLAGQPWLFPSLGPTAYLQTESPAHPSSRFYNTVVGHAVGVVAGFAGIALFNAWNAPVVLKTQQLSWERVGAAAVALGLTVLLALLLKASHPPAGATTLLVALGTFQTLQSLAYVVAGVLIIAVVGEVMRRGRLGQLTLRPERQERRLPAPKPKS